MKKLKQLLLVGGLLVLTNPAQAAFPVSSAQQVQTEATTAVASNNLADIQISQAKTEIKQLQKQIKQNKADASIPKILYIVLAILGWGWLAMGINDNFGDFDWLISLLLYILFYLPGLIYTLIKMKKYYK